MRTLGIALLSTLAAFAHPGGGGKDGDTLLDEVDGTGDEEEAFTQTFLVDPEELSTTGVNPYFILLPGYRLVLQGEEEGTEIRLKITVLDETRRIGKFDTRVVEEREEEDGELVEISRNFFAISTRTNSVYYFGEEVDFFEDGELVGHEGAWLHGQDGARFGLIMPGTPLLGGRYFQEIAPGVALDRAEIVGLDETFETPAGHFKNVLRTVETTPLEPDVEEVKRYAVGVGLIQDEVLRLTHFGFIDPSYRAPIDDLELAEH